MAQYSLMDRQDLARLSRFKAVPHRKVRVSYLAASNTCSPRSARSRTSICLPSGRQVEVLQGRKMPLLENRPCTIRQCSEMKELKRLNLRLSVSTWRSTMRQSTICLTRVDRASSRSGRTRGRRFWRTAQSVT